MSAIAAEAALIAPGLCRRYTPSGWFCRKPGIKVQRACVHEHVAETWACEQHGDKLHCGPCFEVDGHLCVVDLVRLDDVDEVTS